MDFPNFPQLSFFLQNEPDFPIHKLIERDYFFIAFIEHIKEHFHYLQKQFTILVPLLDPFFEEKEQKTTLSLDQIELGELCLLFNSISTNSSLVYSSTSGLLETIVFDYKDYETLSISKYIVLLHEFSAMILGEQLLYQQIKGA